MEILVITIGIIGAFMLNSWKEDVESGKEEQAILKQLREDLRISKTQSEELILSERTQIAIIKAALGTAEELDSLLATDLDNVAHKVFWDFGHDKPVFGYYEDLKSAGKTSLIQSEALRSQLSDLQESINALINLLDDRRSVHILRVDAISENDINFQRIAFRSLPEMDPGEHSNYADLLKDKRIRNLLAIKLELGQSVLSSQIKLDEDIGETLVMVEKEIK